jgi:thiol-disulfide isomerase/thioredoxin
MPSLTILLVCAAAAAVFAVDLTQQNFATLTAGRTTFVKFYAPWCGHCRAMKSSWDALMEDYKEDPHVLIGDCDCTGDCRAICEEMGVQGVRIQGSRPGIMLTCIVRFMAITPIVSEREGLQ